MSTTTTTTADILVAAVLRDGGGMVSHSTDDDGNTWILAGHPDDRQPGDGTRELRILNTMGLVDEIGVDEGYFAAMITPAGEAVRDSLLSGKTFAAALALLVAEDDIEPANAAVAPELLAGTWSIDEDDGEPEALNHDSEALWVVSTHRLMCDGVEVAQWTRCAVGSYGGNGGPGTRPDAWDVSEDTDGGDTLPKPIAALLDVIGLEDDYPAVPEPEAASETHTPDPDGDYAVYWHTVGDDEHVVERYATREAAQAVCDEMGRGLRASNPGRLLCGYTVRVLDGEDWVSVDDD